VIKMSINQTWKNVYDSVVSVSHTGDLIWQTALNITGKGKAEIHLNASGNDDHEIRITIDGTQLIAGQVGVASGLSDYMFDIEWNKSLLLEYRTNDAGETTYLDVNYYNL